MKKRMQEEGGFTLIELLVTIAILGVLFGIVTLTLGGLTTDAQAKSCLAEEAVVQSAVDIYMAAKPQASLSGSELVTDAQVTSTQPWAAAYLRSLPTLGLYTVADTGAVSPGTCPAPPP